MARTIRDANLGTRAARLRLAVGERFFRGIDAGLHLGYRRGENGGTWSIRYYLGAQTYRLEKIGVADDVQDADGHVVLDFAQAQALARKVYVERKRAADGVTATGPYTVKQALDDYVKAYEAGQTKGGGKSPKNVRSRADALILPALGGIEIAKLTAERIRKWLTALADSPARLRTGEGEKQKFAPAADTADAKRRRRSTANRTLTILKAALNYGFREGKVGSDTAWRQVAPFRETSAARVRYLSIAEAKRLISACAPDFRRLVQAALATGARYGELCELRAADFNPDSDTLHVRTSKSGKPRHVVLNDEGAKLFGSLTIGKTGDAFILTKADGSPWGPSHQARPMLEACERAKIKPPINFHSLRHTWASLATMAGAPLMVVGRNLGHADTRMVEKHYGHLAPSYVADAIRAAAPTFGFKADRKVVAISAKSKRTEA